ncbi:MAG: hypothetical protein WC109_04830 [Syntrophomonadaceae bacterium]|nr:hypothetical protein [Syntrophomonadaceae bacterium]MDD3898226.1 hypothetical protein [Syntrophomonadaceae bacterium]
MLAILILIFIVIVALEVPALVRQRYYRGLLVFAGFYIVGVYLGLAQYYGWVIYNPFTITLSKLSYLPLKPITMLVGCDCG